MDGSTVANLGLGPEVWVFLTLLSCLVVFFKFSRFWSIRNLDLILLFAPAPGLLRLVGGEETASWGAYASLFVGTGLLLTRCLLDLGLARRPLLEPNLNSAGLACLAGGVLALLLLEAISLPVREGKARNPADPQPNPASSGGGTTTTAAPDQAVDQVLKRAPLPSSLKGVSPRVVVARILASLAHVALAAGLWAVGAWHFGRPVTGLAMVACYLVLPYTRMALVDCGQLLPAALLVAAVVVYRSPIPSGVLIGLAGGWMPAVLGLIPLWAGYHRGRRALWFLVSAIGVVGLCGIVALAVPVLSGWASDLGARSRQEAGLIPSLDPPHTSSFWQHIDPSYRLPVLIAYLALVVFLALWPTEKNLGELIAQSTALVVASQFWYLDRGGTLIVLYVPLMLLVVFRPNLNTGRTGLVGTRSTRTQPVLFRAR